MEFHQKSRFVNNLAMMSIVVGIYMIYQDISNLTMLQTLSSSPEYRMAEQMMPSLSVSPAETMFDIFMQAAGIIGSVGLMLRMNWGRILYIAVLSIVTLWGIISGIMSYLSISTYLGSIGMGGSLSLLLMGNVVMLVIAGYIVWKLSTEKIRNEFIDRRGDQFHSS